MNRTARFRHPFEPHERRDQPPSAFEPILSRLIAQTPGARAAALVDGDGETVDYAGHEDPYALRVAAAHFRIVLAEAMARSVLGAAHLIAVQTRRATYRVQLLPEAYALLLQLRRGAAVDGGERALAACCRHLAEEAGWSPVVKLGWYAVDVQADAQQRPLRISDEGRETLVEIIGRYTSALRRRELGYRVRLEGGEELTLVREPSGAWFSDEPIVYRQARPGRAPSQLG